jgi:hypothetical protein
MAKLAQPKPILPAGSTVWAVFCTTQNVNSLAVMIELTSARVVKAGSAAL